MRLTPVDGTRRSGPPRPGILLVDDIPAILSFLKARLVRLDCEMVDADDGQRALRLVRLTPIDLVIADVNMPGMDGITFVAELRKSEHERLRVLPVILLTGDKDPEVRRRGLVNSPLQGAERGQDPAVVAVGAGQGYVEHRRGESVFQ